MQHQSANNVVTFPARPGPPQPAPAPHRWLPPLPSYPVDRPDARAEAERRWSAMMHDRMADGLFPTMANGYGHELAALGFRFGAARDGWAPVTLPPGWEWSWRDAMPGHVARPFVVDGEGRDRVSFLMSGKTPETHPHVLRRYLVREADRVPRPWMRSLPASMLAIHDAGVPTDDAIRFDAHDREERRLAAVALEATLEARYPRHKDCLAYW